MNLTTHYIRNTFLCMGLPPSDRKIWNQDLLLNKLKAQLDKESSKFNHLRYLSSLYFD